MQWTWRAILKKTFGRKICTSIPPTTRISIVAFLPDPLPIQERHPCARLSRPRKRITCISSQTIRVDTSSAEISRNTIGTSSAIATCSPVKHLLQNLNLLRQNIGGGLDHKPF